jgi:succinyl-diaminopimelate desuccinylase
VLVRVEVTGKAGHASWPESGINAAVEGARLLARLDELAIPTHPRMTGSQSVLSYHAGSEQYVITIPEKATAVINRMIVPGETRQGVREQVEALAAELDSPARFEVAIDPPFYPPWETPVEHPFVERFTAAYEREIGERPAWEYGGFGDANLFSTEAGIPTIQFGPRGGDYHQANEWVDIPSIATATRVLLRTALTLMPS